MPTALQIHADRRNMKSLIIFSLLVVAFAALVEGHGGYLYKREAAQAAEDIKPDEKGAPLGDDKHKDEQKDGEERELGDDFMAIITIFFNRKTQQPRVEAHQIPGRAAVDLSL